MIDSILAGIMISIGCRVYLSCDRYVGAVLFSVGLITILLFGFNLFTGKLCYIPSGEMSVEKVAMIFFGNAIGCFIIGMMFPSDIASSVWQSKIQLAWYDVFFKAIMCNVLIYVAVELYKVKGTLIPTFFCIPTFILSGYEHSIADICYMVMARDFGIRSFVFLAFVVAGNFIGGFLIPICKIIKKKVEVGT